MRVFVFEHVTGGGYAGAPMIAGLAEEGELMLRALIGDLLQVEGVEVSITRDARLADSGLPVRSRTVGDRLELASVWRDCVAEADAVWPIAPETDGLLQALSESVLTAGRRLLNSSPAAVRRCAAKGQTIGDLRAAGVPVVPTFCAATLPADLGSGSWVLKPDQGVGCMNARLYPDACALRRAVQALAQPDAWVVQPYLPGAPGSLSLLVANQAVQLLGCNHQRVVVNDDSFALLGCVVNGLNVDREEYCRLAGALVDALPGLWGYVGVDFVITEEGPLVLEVNPRLTTSYAGLSRSIGRNVAADVLSLAESGVLGSSPQMHCRSVDVDLELGYVA